jgi:excinuclease ABC subunit A
VIGHSIKPVLSAAPSLSRSEVEGTADWILDLGPEGGVRGGELVAEGTPEEVAANPRSFTGQYLAPMLGKRALSDAEGGREAAE